MSQKLSFVKQQYKDKVSWALDSMANRFHRESLHVMAEMTRGRQVIVLDYAVKSTPRYGYGKPSHPVIGELIKLNNAKYTATLQRFLTLKDKLLAIPTHSSPDSTAPGWINDFIPGLDAVTLYSFVALNKPKRYFEIGSGNSTKFVKKAIDDHNLSTHILSVDPEPRASVNKICDTVIRQPVEETDLTIFDQLEANDILFVDNSHRCLMNSDVTVVFLEILPRLKPGVLIGIHDITLPWDYPPFYISRWYSEQYLLSVLLLAGSSVYEVVMPSWYVSIDSELSGMLDPLWKDPKMADVKTHGCSFWIRKLS